MNVKLENGNTALHIAALRLENLFLSAVKIVCKYSSLGKIVPGYLEWDQEELFDEKTNAQQSRDTVPLNS